ncbi:MAG TPA: hydrolase, partial [Bacillales bacterium]|nr:hydrolase [Bacillales bacterium]
MENRNFQLGNEWNIIYYPEKPTGFGILIIGDERHFVDESKSFWQQNEGKLSIIKVLKESGYTIFSSNLYGKNWGSEKAVELAERLYQHVIRNEIINGKIHIIAEGMGALVAIKLIEKLKGQLRSIIFLDPILSLKQHLLQEKENKFFYKKLKRELESAYQMDFKKLEVEYLLMENPLPNDHNIPLKIIHILSGGRSYSQS